MRFLKVAKRQAEKTTNMRRQVGAVIVDGSCVIAKGHNRNSHTKIPKVKSRKTGKIYYGLHAEISALLQCNFKVKNAIIYVYGQNRRSGKSIYSKPCELCEYFLKKHGVKGAIYSTHTGVELVSYVD